VNDSEVAVDADDDQHQRRQVEAERPPEHEEPTRRVTGRPQHGRVPRHLDGYHDEGDNEVGDSEVHYVQVDARAASTTAEQDDEDDEVTDGSDEEHETIGDDREDAIVAERQLARQAQVDIAARSHVVR